MVRIAVLGLGRVGLRAAYNLASRGFDVLGLDASNDAVSKARSLGLDARLYDVEGRKAGEYLRGERVVAALVTLPYSVASRTVAHLSSAGIPVVAASIKPLSLETGLVRAPVLTEVGVSPGLSNVILYREAAGSGGGAYARVYVGSFGAREDELLSHASTWRVEEMLEQYVTPAKLIQDGLEKEADPLDPSYWMEYRDPEHGPLECFPSQGLAGFIQRRGSLFRDLMECSLRRRGHLRVVLTMRGLGLLDSTPLKVSGCIVRPFDMAVKLVELRYPPDAGDTAVFTVEALRGGVWRTLARASLTHGGGWSASSKMVGGAASAFTEVFAAEGLWEEEPGIIYPEDLYELGLVDRLLSLLPSHGISLEVG
ncbi:saccharopine dehydrogenase C-terminal domain-containing protein [Aeropyrum camini]|uniref:L-lysine 6-dehydrogenase n=1 Tax=Aeropyrum camini SY1 = JCM 12091 TaxID=1198449 RepID=U3T7Z6_9CREN|nr:saccharopine dehydrogenase C-terminal domain-containing protein [Aeropyrum camini]BAN89617.1 L-lysine 6-dehydrogenase [Aeropyrum camini SY1 = JCM 12091]